MPAPASHPLKSAGRLKRHRKHDRLTIPIRHQIAQGILRPGDRLSPVRELMGAFDVSQRVVVEAIRELAAEGLLETRRSSGIFVANCTQNSRSSLQLAGGKASTAGTAWRPPAPGATIELALMDSYPEQLEVLNLAFRHFSDRHPHAHLQRKPLPYVSQTNLAQVPADVIQGTPLHLAHWGCQQFAPLARLDCLAPDVDAGIPTLSAETARYCLPFSLTVDYLFANLDLLAAAGVPVSAPPDLQTLIERGRMVGAEAPPGIAGLGFEGMRDWLMAAGALQFDEGGLTFRPSIARDIFAQCATGRFSAHRESELWPEFAAGRIGYCIQSSYLAVDLLRDQPFRWAAWPVPVAKGALLPGTMAVLAMKASAFHPQDCFDLIECLLAPATQIAYGKLGGNLPVAAEALAELRHTPDRPPQLPPVDAVLAQTTQVWDEIDNFRLYWSVYVASGLTNGHLTPESAVDRVQLALELLPNQLRVLD